MLTNKNVVIKDACILFDLIDLELLDDFFRLDITVVTTSLVISEIIDAEQRALTSEKIETRKLLVDNSGDLQMISALNDEHLGLSLADCSILELSMRQPGIILSSDKSLRNEAKRRNLTVKGVLWVINQLFEKNIRSKADCLELLEIYPQKNKRAPKKDIQKLVDKLNDNTI